MKHSVWMTACCCVLWVGSASAEQVDFSRDVRPLLNKHCVACHGGVKRAGGISFLRRQDATAPAESGELPIRPGSPEQSQMLIRVLSDDESIRMPPAEHGRALTRQESELLRNWIAQGAEWEIHWAYRSPVAAELPPVKTAAWPQQQMDYFVLSALEKAKLTPAPEADRRSWLRRVSFDLVGLPPTPDDVRTFLNDQSAEAYEKVVDRLLNSPAYGERWASVWLDLSRYADTVGYERDPDRTIWPWRDWIVNAYNGDMPYDQFLTTQLAGDLLPGATLSDKLATAFHRNSQTNAEDGSDDEEYRVVALLDRINTTWEGLMSTSFRCVQCHSHPYDPITHEEFYRFAALFNSTQDNDTAEDFPHLAVPRNRADWPAADALDRETNDLRNQLHAEGLALSEATAWHPLRASSAKSTGLTTMTVRDIDGISEITATGNVRLRGVATLDFPLTTKRLTALQIEALPFDVEKAAISSELGFVLSRLRAQIISGNTVIDVPFAAAYDEDPSAFFPVEATFSEDVAGWSAYPRFNRPRRAVFAVAQPVDVPDGATLRLTLEQNAQSTGITAQVIRRGRYTMTDDLAWSEIVRRQSDARQHILELQAQRKAIASDGVPFIREQHASQRRDTRMFVRGNFLDHGPKVSPGVPAIFGDVEITDRLHLVQWMTQPEHPLTSRTAVNRIWQQLFVRGLVEIIEDFGSAGRPPSHPDLLDWLAVRFATELDWSRKRLLRELVLSATYRQDAAVTTDSAERDPGNALLSRGPRTRLTAEMVRDQALAVSGLLSLKAGGPPVMPKQPEGIWRTVYNGGQWITSAGEDAHRRGLYTFVRRTSGYPSFLTFDAPSREVCTVRRISTNTPLQALVTLNDPVFIEAAVALAGRMIASGDQLAEQIGYGYELTAGRPVPPESLPPLVSLYQTSLTRFELDPAAAELVAKNAEQAAMTIVANALLNLDVVLMK